MLQTKRVYEAPEPGDGSRFLVDRVWPRGVKRDSLKLDDWLKDIAPSRALRIWFAHDPARWDEFRRRYFAQLDSKPQTWQDILKLASAANVTLLYSARDREHNNAVALRDYLESKLSA